MVPTNPELYPVPDLVGAAIDRARVWAKAHGDEMSLTFRDEARPGQFAPCIEVSPTGRILDLYPFTPTPLAPDLQKGLSHALDVVLTHEPDDRLLVFPTGLVLGWHDIPWVWEVRWTGRRGEMNVVYRLGTPAEMGAFCRRWRLDPHSQVYSVPVDMIHGTCVREESLRPCGGCAYVTDYTLVQAHSYLVGLRS